MKLIYSILCNIIVRNRFSGHRIVLTDSLVLMKSEELFPVSEECSEVLQRFPLLLVLDLHPPPPLLFLPYPRLSLRLSSVTSECLTGRYVGEEPTRSMQHCRMHSMIS